MKQQNEFTQVNLHLLPSPAKTRTEDSRHSSNAIKLMHVDEQARHTKATSRHHAIYDQTPSEPENRPHGSRARLSPCHRRACEHSAGMAASA